ncbi:hypothetical protein I317_05317 [Kwoniella heveanensis CBS 569]|nr:hypothetical protein I317_05317 [Kwoniella heveanensis CBS 569]
MKRFAIEEPLLDLNMYLGEGCVWDTETQRLYFVDIELNNVFVYEPKSDKWGYSHFEKKVTAIALLQEQEGLIAAIEDGFALIPPSSLPRPLLRRDQSMGAQDSLRPAEQSYDVLCVSGGSGPGPSAITLQSGEARMNEGAVDPAGRFLAGTMVNSFGSYAGRMYSLQRSPRGNQWEAPLVLDDITVTNGMAWTGDGKKMYFTDSHRKEIVIFDYDVERGTMSNRKIFSNIDTPEYGYPDGLCLDSEGGVWTARWSSGKVIRLNPQTAEIDVEIDLPKAWNATCVIFGGANMDELFITTARCSQGGDHPEPHYTEQGKLYHIKDIGFTGVERNRFKSQ